MIEEFKPQLSFEDYNLSLSMFRYETPQEESENYLEQNNIFQFETLEEGIMFIHEKFMNQSPFISAFSSPDTIIVEISLPTEINNFDSDSKKKPFTFTLRKYSSENVENSNSCEDFDNLRKNDTKPDNNFVNKKRERDDYEEDINQEIISKI